LYAKKPRFLVVFLYKIRNTVYEIPALALGTPVDSKGIFIGLPPSDFAKGVGHPKQGKLFSPTPFDHSGQKEKSARRRF
jgi:hypothetical protein